jgi:predicted O-methyltransferase YrrM
MALTNTQISAKAIVDHAALQRHAELVRLVGIVRRQRPRTVVEIGTHNGGTLYAWCQCAAKDALIVSIDLPGGPFGGGYTNGSIPVLKAFARPHQTVVLLQADSHLQSTLAKLLAILVDHDRDGIDFLFIDGDHTYDGVRADFEDYAPAVSAGGLIALHDIAPYPELPECQVERFWDEQIRGRGHRTHEFIHPGPLLGCGIGVVEVPA